MRFLCVIAVLLVVMLFPYLEANAAITKPLTVYSANPRYLATDGKPVVFIGAGRVYPGDTEGHLFEEYV
ncbi:MAG: hypothetical protein K6U00_08540, partial [Armatimonadetes bacterium]|nr:hypothetical protein [Armatimonadota bacterium]